MKLIKKNNVEVYEVADNSWFEQYTEVISEADDNGAVYDFFEENVKGSDIEEDYKEWQKEHFDDYYFVVVQSKQGDFYAVAYESGYRAAFACEIENPGIEDENTYDVIFNDDTYCNRKGWFQTKEYCIDYIKANNGTNESYFECYKGGIAQVVCNETDKIVYEEEVR